MSSIGPFAEWAMRLYDLGLTPTPLGRPGDVGKKAQAAFLKGWQKMARENRPSRSDMEGMVSQFGDRNIGLLMGTLVGDDWQVAAIDVDSNELITKCQRALPSTPTGKFGSKGMNWFVLAPAKMKSRSILRSDGRGMAVEIMCVERQVVIPPSIHPKTNEPYRWVGEDLISFIEAHGMERLPRIGEGCIIEMEEIAKDGDTYFNGGMVGDETKKQEEFPGLNHMTWLGVNNGGNTYDVRLRVIAHMVATGWTDEDIVERVVRAQKEAVEASGEEYDWPDAARETQRSIDDARKKGFGENSTAKGKTKQKIKKERVAANWAQYKFEPCVGTQDLLLKYEDGHWPRLDPDAVKQSMVHTFDDLTAAESEGAYKTLYLLSYDSEFGEDSGDRICLLNGTLNVSTGVLEPWSEEHELFHQVDVEWNEDAECPRYEEFVNSLFDGDQAQIDTFDEFAGLTLVDDMSFQKMLFLLGMPGSGKSTLSDLLTKMHSKESVANVPITSLGDERKTTALAGKLINVSSEQSRFDQISDVIIKQITGGDAISTRRLYKEVESQIRLSVRFLCLANDMPATSDVSGAMWRRVIILDCPNAIPEDKQDRGLLDKLWTEAPGILKRWVKALHRLRERGKFDEPERSIVKKKEWFSDNNPVETWITLYLEKTDPSEAMLDDMLYADYTEKMNANGFKALNRNNWKKRLEAMGYETISCRAGKAEIGPGRALRFKGSLHHRGRERM